MNLKISIKTLLTNASRLERVSGRDFVVVDGLAAYGGSAMNRILYPESVISRKAKSLEGKPAPLSHPKRDGMNVSAEDFFSKGSHDVGGKVMTSTMVGNKNMTKIFVDKEFAERSEGGKELVRRLLAGEEVGLSTGLTPIKTRKESGVDQFGIEFDEVIEDLEYDHLAFLIDETAAGAAAGTKVIINSETGESLEVYTHSDSQSEEPKVNTMIYELNLSELSQKDRAVVQGLTVNEILNYAKSEPKQPTVAEAQSLLESKGMKVNSADSVVMSKEDHAALKANADAYAEAEIERVNEIKAHITANSKMEESDLDGIDEMALTRLANSLTPDNDFSVQDGVTTNANSNEIELPEGI